MKEKKKSILYGNLVQAHLTRGKGDWELREKSKMDPVIYLELESSSNPESSQINWYWRFEAVNDGSMEIAMLT